MKIDMIGARTYSLFYFVHVLFGMGPAYDGFRNFVFSNTLRGLFEILGQGELG